MNVFDWFRNVMSAPAMDRVSERPLTVKSTATTAPGAIPLDRTSCDLAALVCHALRPLLGQAAARDISLLIMPAADFPERVHADGLKLAWALTTLVGNALRYVRNGTRLRPGGSIRVKIAWDAATREAVLSVQDDGEGIPRESLERMLSREVASGRVPSLNLLLLEDIVRAHGGTLSITSPCDEATSGTVVTLLIPCPLE